LGHSKGTSCRTPLAKILDPPLYREAVLAGGGRFDWQRDDEAERDATNAATRRPVMGARSGDRRRPGGRGRQPPTDGQTERGVMPVKAGIDLRPPRFGRCR